LEFGDSSKRKLILIHGFQMPYQIWNRYIDHFRDNYHVVILILPGHYPNHAENFISFSETAKEFEDYFLSKYGRDVFAIYAMSMGGVLAATLWQSGRLKIKKIIFDGSPLVSLNPFAEKIMLGFYLNVTAKSKQRNKRTIKRARMLCPEDSFDDFLKVLDSMTDATIKNCIKGVANFKLTDNPDNQNTEIYYFHGTKTNELIAKKSALFISKHYKNSVIKCFKGKSHCETVMFFPKQMIEELDKVLSEVR
jgi:pimeloyl-ACP methyl ester carboxylesterase